MGAGRGAEDRVSIRRHRAQSRGALSGAGTLLHPTIGGRGWRADHFGRGPGLRLSRPVVPGRRHSVLYPTPLLGARADASVADLEGFLPVSAAPAVRDFSVSQFL